ncbi:MAG: DUF2283 domain-containing protein [Candidatus Aenigmatarchaeota archaeon]
MAEAKIDYDYENDILFLYKDGKVKDSMQMDDFVIDYSFDGNIVGIEIMDVSKMLRKLYKKRITKKLLKSIKNAEIRLRPGKEIVLIVILLKFANREQTEIPLMVPSL